MDKNSIAEKRTTEQIFAMGANHFLERVNYFTRNGGFRVLKKLDDGQTPLVSSKNLEEQLIGVINTDIGNFDPQIYNFAKQALNIYYMELEKLNNLESENTLNMPVQLKTICSQPSLPLPSMVKATHEKPIINSGLNAEKPNASKIAREVVSNHCFAIYQNGIYIFYNGRYKLVTKIAIKRLLNEEYRNEAECYGFAKFYDQIVDFIICEGKLVISSEAFEATKYLIAFQNGFLDTTTMQFYDPDPRLFFTSNIKFNFSAKPCECPNFEKFLWKIAGGNELLIARIYEVIGITISNDLNAKSLFLFQGVPDSGKSTLINLITSFFDEEMTTALSVGEMDRNFAMAEFIGKAICTDTELPKAPIRTGCVSKLKQLTSKDLINSDVKYSDRVSFVSRAKILLATNHPFQLDSLDVAFMNRVVTIPFYFTIPKEEWDTEILESFQHEKLAIVKKAISHYYKLRERKYVFSGNFKVNEVVSTSEESQTDSLVDQVEVIKAFLNRCCVRTGMDQFESTVALHKAYESFCEQYNSLPVDQKQLTMILKTLLAGQIENTKKRVVPGQSARSVFLGIKLKQDLSNKEAIVC